MLCLDEDRLAVGYYDGYIFIKWEKEEYHRKLHSGPVTGFSVQEDGSTLYSCGFDGLLKMINISKEGIEIFPKYFSSNQIPVISMKIEVRNQETVLALTTINGYKIFVNLFMEQQSCTNVGLQKLMAVASLP